MINKDTALYKYAAKKVKEPNPDDTRNSGVAGLTGFGVGSLGVPLASTAYVATPGMLRPSGDTLTPTNDDQIIDYMHRTGNELVHNTGKGGLLFRNADTGHNTIVSYEPESEAPNTLKNFIPSISDTYAIPNLEKDTSYINLGPYSSTPILAHEYGHTTQPSGLLNVAYTLGNVAPEIGTLGTAGALAFGKRNTAKNVAIASSLAGLGTVIPEVHASYVGSQHLDTLGEKLEAFSGNPTYMLHAAAPLAAYYAGSKLQDYLNDKKKGN